MLNYLLLFCLFGASVCQQKRPNIVLVLTDDQDVVLGGMTPMANVRRFIGNEGVTFANSYVTSPICCPSRASLLTGLYVHNHMTVNNSMRGGCYGHYWRNTLQKETFNYLLKEAGYKTFYAGKYLNEYGAVEAGGPEAVPPGWSEWRGLVGNSVYYNYTISNNGVPTASTDQYLTDVIRNLSETFILTTINNYKPCSHTNKAHFPSQRDLSVTFIESQTEDTPFLMVLAPPAPHQPFTPAPRHTGSYRNVTAVRGPNFNVKAEDKHWLLRMPPSPLPDTMLPELDRVYRSRWESLLAVDEMVADVVAALDKQNVLADTYVLFTSDNGYHVGQFSQVYDKRQPYESDIKVPLVIRGPGIAPNSSSTEPVLNIDIAPTILKMAGLTPPAHMDGRPIDLNGNGKSDRYMLVEYHGEGRYGSVDDACPWKYDASRLAECYPQYECKCQDARNNSYACVRHFNTRTNMKYCEFADYENFVEIYDLSRDSFELHNALFHTLPAVRAWYSRALSRLLQCAGDTCALTQLLSQT